MLMKLKRRRIVLVSSVCIVVLCLCVGSMLTIYLDYVTPSCWRNQTVQLHPAEAGQIELHNLETIQPGNVRQLRQFMSIMGVDQDITESGPVFSPDGSLVAVGGSNSAQERSMIVDFACANIWVWHLGSNEVSVLRINEKYRPISFLMFSPDSIHLLSAQSNANENRTVWLWDIDQVAIEQGSESFVSLDTSQSPAVFDSEEGLFGYLEENGWLPPSNPDSERIEANLSGGGSNQSIFHNDSSANLEILATITLEGVEVYDIATSEILLALPNTSQFHARNVRFNPEGTLLVVTGIMPRTTSLTGNAVLQVWGINAAD